MKKFAVGLVLLCGLVLNAGVVHPQATIGGEWRDDVAALARRIVGAGLTPGMAVAVSQGDWVLYSEGFGLADISGRPVGDETAFYIASTSKALTATAVMVESASGAIALDDPINRYIPGLAFRAPLDASRLTIRDLLTMTDGVENGGPVVIRSAYTGDFTTPLLVRLLGDYGPDQDGRAFSYDNLPYNILGLALDPTTLAGWKDVVHRNVLAPLGMRATNARLSTMDLKSIALPHALTPAEGWRRVPLAKEDRNQHAAGGHFAPARDLARFVAAHASGGMLEGERIFPADVIHSTHRKHADQDQQFGPFHRFGWGYGWDLGTYEGKTIVHRFGAFSGYRSHVSFEPASQIGVVVLVNGSGPASAAADLMATYVYDRLLGRADLVAEYDRRLDDVESRRGEFLQAMTASLAERVERMSPLPHPLSEYEGTYESPRLGTMTWRSVAEGLEVRMGIASSRAEVFNAPQNELRVELFGGGSVAAFEFPAGGGRATAVTLNGERFERSLSSP